MDPCPFEGAGQSTLPMPKVAIGDGVLKTLVLPIMIALEKTPLITIIPVKHHQLPSGKLT